MSKLNSSLIPFYSNTPDDTRCVQACSRMILKHFLNREFSWKELDDLVKGKPGTTSSPLAALMGMEKLGLETIVITAFDHKKFARDGMKYMRALYGNEIADWQIANGDMEKSREISRQFLLSPVQHEHRSPVLKDIKFYLDRDYAVWCGLNSKTLDGKNGYRGHAVVILNIDSTTITLHDPGHPPRPSRKVSRRTFLRAWENHGPNIRAIRLRVNKQP